MRLIVTLALTLLSSSSGSLVAHEQAELKQSLLFLASFDESVNADQAAGDGELKTAENLQRQKVETGLSTDAVAWNREQGKYGGCLSFKEKTDAVVFFNGGKNLPDSKPGMEGTISFWLCLTPNDDLPSGYVDPLQITDKKWNDSSIFVDFTDKNPRQFRLGVFSDYAFWNPDDQKWEEITESERPLVTVKRPPFTKDAWTHVAITFQDLNQQGQPGSATLYLDGKSQGTLKRPMQITWAPEKTVIILGIYYVGDLDEFAVFDRCLPASLIQDIAESEVSLKKRIE